jgi:hypothetical protein
VRAFISTATFNLPKESGEFTLNNKTGSFNPIHERKKPVSELISDLISDLISELVMELVLELAFSLAISTQSFIQKGNRKG